MSSNCGKYIFACYFAKERCLKYELLWFLISGGYMTEQITFLTPLVFDLCKIKLSVYVIRLSAFYASFQTANRMKKSQIVLFLEQSICDFFDVIKQLDISFRCIFCF